MKFRSIQPRLHTLAQYLLAVILMLQVSALSAHGQETPANVKAGKTKQEQPTPATATPAPTAPGESFVFTTYQHFRAELDSFKDNIAKIQACRRFIKVYPENPYINEVMSIMDELQNSFSAQEKRLYERILKREKAAATKKRD
jgi:hypothetical protein